MKKECKHKGDVEVKIVNLVPSYYCYNCGSIKIGDKDWRKLNEEELMIIFDSQSD